MLGRSSRVGGTQNPGGARPGRPARRLCLPETWGWQAGGRMWVRRLHRRDRVGGHLILRVTDTPGSALSPSSPGKDQQTLRDGATAVTHRCGN